MKTMCPPGYQHYDFVATHAFGHMMYAHLASVRFIYMIIYMYETYIHEI